MVHKTKTINSKSPKSYRNKKFLLDGFVYFVQAGGEGGPIKIGYTQKSVQSRVNSLQTACPMPLKCLYVIEGNTETETSIHKLLKSERIRGEWFNPCPAILNFINDSSIPLDVWFSMKDEIVR